MKLYHGTTADVLPCIIREGIKPRGGNNTDNWKNTVSSNPNCVYLTTAYPLHFMWNAMEKDERFGVIVEVDSDLCTGTLLPDEDVLAQLDQQQGKISCTGKTLFEKTKWYRKHLLNWADSESWKTSIDAMGTCCHLGTIIPEAITRSVTIDIKKNRHLVLLFDPSISLMNYQIMGPIYRAFTAALFGDEPDKQQSQTLDQLCAMGYKWKPNLVDPIVRSHN